VTVILAGTFGCSSEPPSPDDANGSATEAATGASNGRTGVTRSSEARTDADASPTCPASPAGLVRFSVPSGVFRDTVAVALSTESGAEIRYTTDRTAPTPTSTRYAGTLRFTRTTNLRAQAFVEGAPVGEPADALYVSSSIDAAHDVPVMVLDSYGVALPPPRGIVGQMVGGLFDRLTSRFRSEAPDSGNPAFRDAAMLLYEPHGGEAVLSSRPAVASAAAYHIRGQSSISFAKRPYRLELRDGFGDDRDCPMTGMPAESDWVLHPPFPDKALVRNAFAYSLGRDMGMAAPRAAFVELYVNDADRPLARGDYRGVYLLVETIKNQRDRLHLRQLRERHTTLPSIAGGYIFRFEWRVTGIEQELACPRGTAHCWNWLEVSDPSPWNEPQREYLTAQLVALVKALHSSSPADPETGYPAYIDVASFVDQVIVHEFTRNMDAFARSQYFYKDRDTKIFAGPLWDYDLIAGVGTSGLFANLSTSGWQYESNASRIGATADWFPILIAEPAFRAALAARWRELRMGLLSDAAIQARIASLTEGLDAAAARNFERWPNLTTSRISYFETPTAATWQEQVTVMQDWLIRRAAWLDTAWR
jgi:hypothetical protein